MDEKVGRLEHYGTEIRIAHTKAWVGKGHGTERNASIMDAQRGGVIWTEAEDVDTCWILQDVMGYSKDLSLYYKCTVQKGSGNGLERVEEMQGDQGGCPEDRWCWFGLRHSGGGGRERADLKVIWGKKVKDWVINWLLGLREKKCQITLRSLP